eukprot:TRINITY_DN3020_c0_g1_i1.p2 TRINITY_DN3020_c0_g1~~TRINITY_DN3020_c0_g1_i1.p2  ORF type:complete len:102 (+),score=7.93 TRINITY_DN3020_c0_g1_i1:1871-2176(+)
MSSCVFFRMGAQTNFVFADISRRKKNLENLKISSERPRNALSNDMFMSKTVLYSPTSFVKTGNRTGVECRGGLVSCQIFDFDIFRLFFLTLLDVHRRTINH